MLQTRRHPTCLHEKKATNEHWSWHGHFTPQYEGLEKLYRAYHDQGFDILDFPCNQFGHQAPGTAL